MRPALKAGLGVVAFLLSVTTLRAQHESQTCPVSERNSGTTVTLEGHTIQSDHDLAFSVDGCKEEVLLTFAGASDNSVPVGRLRQDKNLKRFKKFASSVYPPNDSHLCFGCSRYGPTRATLIGQLEVIEEGATRDQNGILRDKAGKKIWKPGFGHPMPLYIYGLVITSVESASAQKLPPPAQ